MIENSLYDKFWIKEKNGILTKKRKEKLVRIINNEGDKKATLEVTSVSDFPTIMCHQILDCNKCLIMTEKSSKKGKLALVPSLSFDKHMGKGLVLEHHDQDALQMWEKTLRKFLRVVSYPVVIATKHSRRKSATLHISPTRLYLSRGFPPKFSYLGSWDISLHAKNLILLQNGIQLDVYYDGADNLTLTTEDASDIFDTITGCHSRLEPAKDIVINMDSIVPYSRRRLASMPTSIRNEMSLSSSASRKTSSEVNPGPCLHGESDLLGTLFSRV